MLDAGLTGRWVPTARVRHSIPRERQTTRYLRGYFFAQGQRRPPQTPDGVPKLWGRPRWLWRRAMEAELTYRMRRLGRRPETWIRDLIEASVLWGQLRGVRDATPPHRLL